MSGHWQATPKPTNTPIPPSATPTSIVNGSSCYPKSIQNVSIARYLAPIPGNPIFPQIFPISINTAIRVDKYAVDEIQNRLWFYIADPATYTAATPITPVYGDPKALWYGWVQVVLPKGPGFVQNPITGKTILVPRDTIDVPYSSGLPLSLRDINQCLENSSFVNGSVILPDLSQVPWNTNGSSTPFTFLPISLDNICATNHGIAALGLYNKVLYANLNGFHNGVDFFGPEDSAVYSVGSQGIIVGIGEGKSYLTDTPTPVWKPYRSDDSWGADYVYDTQTLKDIWGYSIIVRYQHFFVLYGHIKHLAQNVYVGAQVDAGTLLGSIGQAESSASPHLHIEARTIPSDTYNLPVPTPNNNGYQQGLENPFVTPPPTATGVPNKFGLLHLYNNSPNHYFDITQMFQDPTSAYQSDNSSIITSVTGLGASVAIGSKLTFGGCVKTYYITADQTPVVQPVATWGVRGFRVAGGGEGVQDPRQFVYTATPPSIYPTVTP